MGNNQYYEHMKRKLTAMLAKHKNEEAFFRLILLVVALAAGCISIWIGLRQSVWFDEAYSILLAKQPLGELLRLTALDTHPPLYYILLKGWASIFGWSELSLRMASVGSMVLAAVVGGLLLRKMFGPKLAIGGMLALMIAPLLLRYGFEIRMYADASLIGIAATYALYSAWQSKGRGRGLWLILYGVLVAVGMYLLYYLAFLWIAHVVWLVYVHVRRKQTWRRLLPYGAAYMGAVVLFLPWLPTFLGQTSNGALAPIGQPLNLDQLLGIATFNILYQPLYMLSIGLTVVTIAISAALIWAIPRARRELNTKRDEVALLGMYIGVPIALLMAVSLFRSMYTERYLSHVAVGLLLLLGVMMAAAVQHERGARRRSRWALGIVYGALLIGTIQLASLGNFNFQRLETPSVNKAAARLQDCAPSSRLLAADPYVMTELSYYLSECPMYFVSQWDTLRGGYAPFSGSKYQIKDVNTLNDQSITYVFYGSPDQPLPAIYKERAKHTYGALNVVEYQRSE